MELFIGGLGLVGGAVLQSVTDQSVAELKDLLRRARRRGNAPDDRDGLRPDDPDGLRRALQEVASAVDDRPVQLLLRSFLRDHGALPPERLAAPHPFLDQEELRHRAREFVASALAAQPDAALTVLLHGPPGSGTTSCARQLATELAGYFPGGHHAVDLGGGDPSSAQTGGSALTELLLDAGLPEESLPRTAAAKRRRLRRLLAGTRPLLLLDDAHSAAQIGAVRTEIPGSLTLVTAASVPLGLAGDAGAVLPVEPLPEEDSWELLRQLGAEPDRDDRELRAVVRAGHPGSLRDVAAVRRRVAGRMLAGGPREGFPRVPAAGAGTAPPVGEPMPEDGGEAAGRATLRILDGGYRTLTPLAQRLHARLGRLPHAGPGCGVTAAPVARFLDVDEAEAADACAELTSVGLLSTPGNGRYRQPAAARRHARGLPAEVPGVAVLRLLEHYREVAVDADRRVMRGRWVLGPFYTGRCAQAQVYGSDGEALDTLRTERSALVESVVLASDSGFAELAAELCEAMWGFHLRLGFHEDCLRTHGAALGAAVDGARGPRLADPRLAARLHVQRGFSYRALGEPGRAADDFARAKELEPDDHVRGRATAVESLGYLRLDEEEYTAARACFTEAAAYATDPRARALLLHNDARALTGLGRAREALPVLDAALLALRDLPGLAPPGDLYNRAKVLVTLARTHAATGRPDAGVEALREALDLFDGERALPQEAEVAELLADRVPDASERRGLRQRALRLRKALGDLEAADRLRGLLESET